MTNDPTGWPEWSDPTPAPQPPAPIPSRPRKSARRFIWPAVAAVAVIGWIATAAAGGSQPSAATAGGVALPAPTVTVTTHDLAAAPATPAATVKATPTPTPKPVVVKATIPDGYSADIPGDVPAGRYKTRSDSADCYYVITKTGSPDDIIDNGGFIKGTLTVTLKKGETFGSTDCGDWKQQ